MIMGANDTTAKVKKECGRGGCTLPTIEYIGGEIVVFNEHRGAKHINHIDIGWILDQAVLDGKGEDLLRQIKRRINVLKPD